MNLTLSSCRICCGERIEWVRELKSILSAEMCRYFRCKDCGTVMDEATLPLDYSAALFLQAASPSMKFYLQVGCGVASIASSVLLGMKAFEWLAPGGSRRFLDIGAALGHAVSLAQMKGYQSLGIEPSSMGSLGKELFGVDIVENYLAETRLPENSFDVIHASEVIEHVQDPEAFIRSLACYLSDKGVIILTTPNAETALAGEKVEKEWYELFSPGTHLNLFSAKSIRLLLQRNGIRHVRVFSYGGSSKKKTLWVVGSNHSNLSRIPIPPLREIEAEGVELTVEWLKHIEKICESQEDFGVLYQGTLFRLFEHFMSKGRFAEALPVSQKLDQILEKSYNGAMEAMCRVERITFDDYLPVVPAFAGIYLYFKGILHLNHLGLYAQACEYFTQAQRLLGLEASMAYYQSSRVGWPANARLKQGIARLHAGHCDEALSIFRELSESNACAAMPHEAKEIWFYRGLSYFYKREYGKALGFFARHMTKKPVGYASAKLSLNYFMQALLGWLRAKIHFL